jgi:hypothetical protein
MVAVDAESDKAPIDFVFFGRYRNDNNNERLAAIARLVICDSGGDGPIAGLERSLDGK